MKYAINLSLKEEDIPHGFYVRTEYPDDGFPVVIRGTVKNAMLFNSVFDCQTCIASKCLTVRQDNTELYYQNIHRIDVEDTETIYSREDLGSYHDYMIN